MNWRKELQDYDILIPPLDKPFQEFSHKDAEDFFNWYQEKIPSRIAYLSEKSNCHLDYTFESLIPLWKWFLKVAKIEPITNERKEEIRSYLEAGNRQPFTEYILQEENRQFSLVTEYILRDISMYVGEVFVKHFPLIKWSYHTDIEQDSFANIPLLDGFMDESFSSPFPMQFEPTHMIGVVAANLFDNSDSPNDLYNLCMIWCAHIPHA